MLLSLFVAGVLPALQVSSAGSLPTMHVDASKAAVLVGEPLKVTVTWTTAQAIEINPESVEFWLDYGEGFRRHVETSYQTGFALSAPVKLDPSRPLKTSDTLGVSGGGLPGAGTAFSAAFFRPWSSPAQSRLSAGRIERRDDLGDPPEGRRRSALRQLLVRSS